MRVHCPGYAIYRSDFRMSLKAWQKAPISVATPGRSYIEECETKQCSGAICIFHNHAWVARNNDTYVPELWGYTMIREVDGRIPSISFSMEGDVFAPTGVNKEKLWLHYNFLPVWDKPSLAKPHMPAYVFLTEALELCRTSRMSKYS